MKLKQLWMKVDTNASEHWKVISLATRMGVSQGDAFLCVFRVWARLYERGGGVMPPEEIDGAARHQGFSELLLVCQLAEATLDGIRVKGDERVAQLQQYRTQRSLNAKHRKDADKSSARTEQTASEQRANSHQYYSFSYSESSPEGESVRGGQPQLALVPSEPARPSEAEEWLEWFNRKFSRAFTCSKPLVRAVNALVRHGHTVRDMKLVALFKREKWEADPKMAGHLVPLTLLRQGTFQQYLDEAREWFGEGDHDAA